MKRIICLLVTYIILLFSYVPPVSAKYDPLSAQNNKYGIHIADPNDIPFVPKLINSGGGDWGYVTLVIQENDRDIGKWQTIFNEMRRLHLIPIVRLATYPKGDAWAIPEKQKLHEWVDFFSNLNWVIENRYIVLFNEPNHANEWGNTLNPEQYAEILYELGTMLKTADNDYFILSAGLDFSASTTDNDMEASQYLKRMVSHKPEILTLLDGWTSHSYPNPGFTASPQSSGKGSIRSFIWEMDYLESLGGQKDLPIFITETGWKHTSGVTEIPNALSTDQVATYYTQAEYIWNTPNIVAVTPFVYSYQGEPFDHFSFKKLAQDEFYPHYYAYQNLVKQKGAPKQHERFYFESQLVPETLVAGSMYTLKTNLYNIGQSILDPEDNYVLEIKTENNSFVSLVNSLPIIEPSQHAEIIVTIYTPVKAEAEHVTISLKHNDTVIRLEEHDVILIPPPALDIRAQLAWKQESNAQNIKVILYNKNEEVIHEFKDLSLFQGRMKIKGLYDVIPHQTYRIVVIVPSYLPRQSITKLNETNTTVYIPRFIPLDMNNDGEFTLHDIPIIIKVSPFQYITSYIF